LPLFIKWVAVTQVIRIVPKVVSGESPSTCELINYLIITEHFITISTPISKLKRIVRLMGRICNVVLETIPADIITTTNLWKETSLLMIMDYNILRTCNLTAHIGDFTFSLMKFYINSKQVDFRNV
jgi:hypothetical protein